MRRAELVLERLLARRTHELEARRPTTGRRQPDIRVLFFPAGGTQSGTIKPAWSRASAPTAMAPQPRARGWPGPRPD